MDAQIGINFLMDKVVLPLPVYFKESTPFHIKGIEVFWGSSYHFILFTLSHIFAFPNYKSSQRKDVVYAVL